MTFDEFADKLQQIKKEYLKASGKPIVTIDELESYLAIRLVRSAKLNKGKGLRSLKGIF